MKKRLIPRLKEIQNRCGCVSQDEIEKLSSECGLPAAEIYGAATFYSFLSPRPLGKNIIRVCKSLPCDLRDYGSVLEAIKKRLNIDIGGTTPDRKFSLLLTNCIGACDMAPAIMINEKIYGSLTSQKVIDILDNLQ